MSKFDITRRNFLKGSAAVAAAGAAAAIEAHDAGAKVIVVEKQPGDKIFNNTRMSGGYFHNPDPTGNRAARVEYIKAMMSGENLAREPPLTGSMMVSGMPFSSASL